MNKLKIYAHKMTEDAVIPEIQYNGTSAAFDLTCTETVEIPAKGCAVVKNGLNLLIDESEQYYMTIHLRSSIGFKKLCAPHQGIVDAGYTGEISVLVHNLGTQPVKIEKGDRYAQILVHKKPEFEIVEVDDIKFEELKSKQQRADGGFGSSGK